MSISEFLSGYAAALNRGFCIGYCSVQMVKPQVLSVIEFIIQLCENENRSDLRHGEGKGMVAPAK
jgi:hypothetical protein